MPSGVRRKKHNRSSISKVTRRTKTRDRTVRIYGNPIIQENWDKNLTLAQNYKKLGLTAKLSAPSGGSEKDLLKAAKEGADEKKPERKKKLGKNEGRIVRDEDGNVLKIEYAQESDNEEEWTGIHDNEEQKTEVVKQLEEYAKHGITKPRVQSDRESEWIEKLVEKHGDNVEAMFWDTKLNIYQQSIGDLKRRVNKWKKKNGLE